MQKSQLPKRRLQCACADVFTRPTLFWFHANGRNIYALLFAGHRTIEMLGLVAPKCGRFQTIRNKYQHCCGTMQTNVTCWAKQCCVRLHMPLVVRVYNYRLQLVPFMLFINAITTVFNFTRLLGVFHQEKIVFRLPSIIPYMARRQNVSCRSCNFVFLKYRSSSATHIA